MDLDAAIGSVVSNLENITFLKQEQTIALKAFVEKKDVFAVLPTGFGKSLIYQIAPLVAKKLGLYQNPVVVVVSPLDALMDEQIREATSLGLTAFRLGKSKDDDILSGRGQLIFGSPESWLLNKKWRDMLSSDVFKDNLMGICVDEVHLTYGWGLAKKREAAAFRESFSKLGDLRSLVKEGTPVLALTASADVDSRARVKKQLHMDNVNTTTVTVSPNRTNVRIGVVSVSDETLESLDWVVKEVKTKGLSMSHILIYCRQIKTLARVFNYFLSLLDEDAYVDRDPEQRPENLLIGMFHSHTHAEDKTRLLSSLSGEGNSRVIVATTALGLGLNVRTVSHVIMYGVPDDVESIVQQAGRAGRDGSQSHAAVYVVKQHRQKDEGVKEFLAKCKKGCCREALYSKFEEQTTRVEPKHLCCTYCHILCKCTTEGCGGSMPNYELLPEEVSGRCREVQPEDKVLIREKLEQYMAGLVPANAHLITSQKGCTGFDTELIDTVLNHSHKIFDLAYIKRNIPVFFERYAHQILKVIGEVFQDIDGFDASLFETSDSTPYNPPDMYYTGHFDEPDVQTGAVSSSESDGSLVSAMSGLSLMSSD